MHVMLDDDPPEDGDAVALSLAVAQERIRGLEEQVARFRLLWGYEA